MGEALLFTQSYGAIEISYVESLLAPEEDAGIKVWCKVEIEKVERCAAFLRKLVEDAGENADPSAIYDVEMLERSLAETKLKYSHLWVDDDIE